MLRKINSRKFLCPFSLNIEYAFTQPYDSKKIYHKKLNIIHIHRNLSVFRLVN